MINNNLSYNVSIIIPTYNRSELLLKVLPSYLNQNNVSEIIIIDDGSQIHVKDFLLSKGFIDKRLKIIRHERTLGSCCARNTGIWAAECEWIFFGEDDLILSENHIKNLHLERIRLKADIICGCIIQQNSNENLDNTWNRSKKNISNIFNDKLISINYGTISKATEMPFAHAIFMAPAEILKKFKFSTRLGGPSFLREDQEIQLTLREAGYRLFMVPDAIGLHLSRSLSHGSGTRIGHSFFIDLASSIVNTWQVLDQHYETISPFFGNIKKKSMIRRAISWLIIINIKRTILIRFPSIERFMNLNRKLFNT